MNLQAAHERFTLQLHADGRSHHTIDQYNRHIALLGRWMTTRDIDDLAQLGHEDIAGFLCSPIATRQGDGRPRHATTMNALRSSLKGFLGYLHAAGLLATNPTQLTRRAIVGAPDPKSLSEDEQRDLLAALEADSSPAGQRDRVLFRLLLGSGIRIGSALDLDVQDLDLRNAELSIRRLKGNRHVRLPIASAVRDLLAAWIGDRRTGPVFPGREGGRLTRRQAARRLVDALERASVARPASPHGLRHTFATNLLSRTRDIALVQAALCHRSIQSTLVYTRIPNERLRAALEFA